MSISIIIPVYNEVENINSTYDNLAKAIDILNIDDYEIIFINDCSTDESLNKIIDLKKKNVNIKILNNHINMGLSKSIQNGINASQKKYIWWIPSDDNLEALEITKMLRNYDNFHFIFTKHVIQRGFFRKFVSDGYTYLVNIIFNLKMPYYNSLFLIRNECLKK